MTATSTAVPDPQIAGKRLLVLGGGLWQLEYVRRSRQLGAEVWLTDWAPTAIARDHAHHFRPIDLRHRDATLALAREAQIDAVMTPADIGVPTAAFVAEQLGLPGVTPPLAEQATNKFEMRRKAAAIGLRCPWFVRVTDTSTAADATRERALPVIVKPVDGWSSRGVEVVDRAERLQVALERALQASLSGTALIEEFLTGEEGSIEAFVQNGQVTILGICDKTKSPLPDRFDLELRYPGAYPLAVWRRLEEFTTRLVSGFGITNSMLHIEVLVLPSGEVVLIEFALRGCGSKVVTHLLPQITGVDIVHAIIRQAFGLTTPLVATRRLHGVLHFLMLPTGRISAVHGLERARALPGIIDVTIERQPGDVIEPVHDGRSRPGHLLAWGHTATDAQDTVRLARDAIRIDYEHQAQVPPLPRERVTA